MHEQVVYFSSVKQAHVFYFKHMSHHNFLEYGLGICCNSFVSSARLITVVVVLPLDNFVLSVACSTNYSNSVVVSKIEVIVYRTRFINIRCIFVVVLIVSSFVGTLSFAYLMLNMFII